MSRMNGTRLANGGGNPSKGLSTSPPATSQSRRNFFTVGRLPLAFTRLPSDQKHHGQNPESVVVHVHAPQVGSRILISLTAVSSLLSPTAWEIFAQATMALQKLQQHPCRFLLSLPHSQTQAIRTRGAEFEASDFPEQVTPSYTFGHSEALGDMVSVPRCGQFRRTSKDTNRLATPPR
ncbi:hypothetical protein VTK26DRAFT_2899 [Humicola hyalothermophila]